MTLKEELEQDHEQDKQIKVYRGDRRGRARGGCVEQRCLCKYRRQGDRRGTRDRDRIRDRGVLAGSVRKHEHVRCRRSWHTAIVTGRGRSERAGERCGAFCRCGGRADRWGERYGAIRNGRPCRNGHGGGQRGT